MGGSDDTGPLPEYPPRRLRGTYDVFGDIRDTPTIPKLQWERFQRTLQSFRDMQVPEQIRRQVISVHTQPALLHLWRACLPRSVQVPALQMTVENFYGQILTPELYDRLSWLLAGNIDRLNQGYAVGSWSGQPLDEWAPLVIESVDKRFNLKKHESVYNVSAICWGGSATTYTFRQRWSWKFCRMMSAHLGFSKPRGPLPFQDPHQMVGMQFLGLLSRDEIEAFLRFTRVHVTPSMQSRNKQLLKMRTRRLAFRTGSSRAFPCPARLSTQIACHHCPYGSDVCPVACRPQSLVRATCSACGEEGWCEPAPHEASLTHSVVCLTCREKEAP